MSDRICPACKDAGIDIWAQTLDKNAPISSAEARLNFVSGNCWVFPYKGLPHCVKHHNFLPPKEFVEDVMTGQLQSVDLVIASRPMDIDSFFEDPEHAPQGSLPEGFLDKLHELVAQVHSGRGSGYFRSTFF